MDALKRAAELFPSTKLLWEPGSSFVVGQACPKKHGGWQQKNNATFNLLSSMEKPGSKGGELSFRHCVAASTAAAAAASTAYLTRLQTIIFLWQAFKWLRYIAQRLLMTFQDILFSNLCSQRFHPKVKLDWEHLWYL